MRGGLTRRMIIASALLAALTSAAFVILILAIGDQRKSAQLALHSQQTLVSANQVERLLVDVETGIRGYLLTGDDSFLQPAEAAEASFEQASNDLVALTLAPVQTRTAQAIKTKGRAYIQRYALPLITAAQQGDLSARRAARLQEGRARLDDLRREFTALESTGRRLAAERDQSARTNANQARIAAIAGLAGSVVLVGFFASYMTRAIVRPVRRSSAMAGQLASGDLATRMPATGVAEIGALERSFNTMAGSLQRSQAELEGLLDEQAALRRVATLVAQATPPEKVFPAVSEEVARLLGVDGTRMMRYEADGTVTIMAGSGEPAIIPAGTRIALEGRNIAALVRSTSTPARVDSFADAPGPLAAIHRDHGVRSGVGAPITVEGRLWGVMVAFSMATEPLPPGTESRLADFTDLVGTAIANAQTRADLTASRARVVAAADDMRRRIERDLHDGTQQRLVSLTLDLRNAQADVPKTDPDHATELANIADGLVVALDDLREISRGIHPALLAKGGLEPALKALARRSPDAVELDIDLNRRLPDQVEIAAYYLVAEALTNAAKHAQATAIWIDADVADDRLRLTIRDDGIGGADPTRGSGLTGLTDRVEALGGTITVLSPPDEGTTIQVWLPLTPPNETA